MGLNKVHFLPRVLVELSAGKECSFLIVAGILIFLAVESAKAFILDSSTGFPSSPSVSVPLKVLVFVCVCRAESSPC